MFLNFLNVFLDFIYRIKLHMYFSLIILLLLSIIKTTSVIPSFSNKDTSLVNIQQTITDEFIKDHSDLFLISTKDGYLHAINKDNKEIWKIYLEQELMSSTISTIEFGKDFILYPRNEQIYIYKDNNLISFNIFIKDLVKRNYLKVGKFSLLGKTKTTLFIIDVDTGEIIQKIDDESNFTFKKKYILTKNKNTISVVRVDYILNCLEVGEEQKNWNVSYSDIMIEKGNENFPDNFKIIPPNIKSIINEYNINNEDEKNDIKIDNIITAYSYFNKDLPTIKIYDRSNSENEGEIRRLLNYNNENRLEYKDNINNDENILEYKDNNNNNDNINNHILEDLYKKNDLLKLPNYLQDENKNNINKDNNNLNINDHNKKYKLYDKIKNNWYLYIIIIILLVQLTYYKGFYIDTKKKEKEKKEEESNIKKNNDNNIKEENNSNKEIINKIKFENISIENNKTISFKNINNLKCVPPVKKYSFDARTKNKNKNNKNENSIENIENKELQNSNDEIKLNSYLNSNNNTQKVEDKKENSIINKKTNGIWDESDDEDGNENGKENSKITKSIENSIKSKNGIWDEDEDKEADEDKDEYSDNNKENSKKTENIDNTIKSTNGIWDDDDDDENEEDKKDESLNDEKEKTQKSINNSKNISNNIKENDSDSYEHKETNEKTKNSKEINNHKKEKKLNRLDTDFENLEKIGEGGFGIVLKGTHKIDKDIYAIKIIDLTYNKKEYEEIISEAKKMNSIKGEYIVNYSICWYDDNLGSAEKFFIKKDNTSSINSFSNESDKLSKSITFKASKLNKGNILCKYKNENDGGDIFNIKEINDEDNYDENNICFNYNNSKNKSKDKNANTNNSLEFDNNNTNQIYNNRSKYCFDYLDDSRLLNNSIISRKYKEEIYDEKDKKYFFILMEYCDGLTLENYIKEHSNKTIERKIIYTYIKQILKALKKLHKNGIIHRDIKPGNIFIKNDQIKIGDFGLATKFQKNTILQTKDLRGLTPSYAAPEQTNSKTYNEKIDIYATGITLYEMCSCFGTEMERQLALRDLKNKSIISERIINDYPQEGELIIRMTKKDYNDRPSAEQILKSDIFIELGKIVNK